MSNVGFIALGSIEAVRPVFLIVMGVFLTLIAWRLARTSGPWTARMLISGALLLGFGYAVMMPLYEAGVLKYYAPQAHDQGNVANIVAWHAVKLVVMNAGWLLFGIGIAMHAKILSAPARPLRQQTRSFAPHETAA